MLELCIVGDEDENGYSHSRVKDYWQSFSSLHNISKDRPPNIFFLGTKDSLIAVAIDEAWDKDVKVQGKVSELQIYEVKNIASSIVKKRKEKISKKSSPPWTLSSKNLLTSRNNLKARLLQ